MAERSRGRWRGWVATAAVLIPVIGIVVYTSLRVGTIDCEVCIRMDGREACRTVTAATREDALRGAIDNACAQLTSGVTGTLRCSRTEPSRAECRATR